MSTIAHGADDDLEEVDEAEYEDETPDIPMNRRRIMTPVTWGLLAVLLAVGAFYGGIRLEKSQADDAAAGGFDFAALAAQAGGAVPGATGDTTEGETDATAAASGTTIGTVKLVDGANVYVTDSSGNTVKLTTDADTTISVSSDGTTADLAPGDTVIAQGETNDDGTVAATSISTGTGFPGGGGAAGGLGAFGGALPG